MSQRQLRGTARARGEEAVDELQHRTRVKPREAGLVEASVAAGDFLGVARASFYRQRPVLGPPASPPPEPALPAERPAPARP